jgi:DNA-binding SARP family transcriptional activator
VDFRLLGPLVVECDGHVLALGGAHQRALLALLIIRCNQALSAERLIGELWDEPADPRLVKRLHVGVSRLRRALGEQAAGPRLVTARSGYRLWIAPGELDADRFERLVADGQAAFEDGQPDRAVATLDGALALWRGAPLADFAFESFAQPEIARLDELRLLALETRFEACLAVNRHREVIADLERLVAEHPLRERLRAQLMLALYRAGRHAHALESYQAIHRSLVGELGLEPGRELRRLGRRSSPTTRPWRRLRFGRGRREPPARK